MNKRLKDQMWNKILPCTSGTIVKSLDLGSDVNLQSILILNEDNVRGSDFTFIETDFFATIKDRDCEYRFNGALTIECSNETDNVEYSEMVLVLSGYGIPPHSEIVDNDMMREILNKSEVKFHLKEEDFSSDEFKTKVKKIIELTLFVLDSCIS